MRVPSALVLLLPAAAAQTITTTDVFTPSILSAAGNDSGLPGGNSFCDASLRVRKPWGALTADEQSLYLQATAMAVEAGGVAQFAAIAADSLSQAQGEYSCAFFSWHRRQLLAYESYLRDLDDRFACLTLPYYDVHTAYLQAVNGDCTNMFDCSGIFDALGGTPNSTDKQVTLTFDGVKAQGYAVSNKVYTKSCDDSSNCGYVLRNDLASKSVPSAASFGSFQSVVASSGDYATFLEGIQYGVHNEVLDAVGGTLASAAAARDVLYYSWYSALDMYAHVYHLCRIGVPVTNDQIVQSLEVYANATQTCGGVNGVDAASALVMRIKVNGVMMDASKHPTLGQYFGYVGSENWNYADIQQLGDYAYTYQLPEMLRQQILSNNDMCTGFNRAFSASFTTLDAATVQSTTTSKRTTKTTTTTTTKIVDGKKVTTTKVTKVMTNANSSSSTSGAMSTMTSGQLKSNFNYTYLGDFSTDNVLFTQGTIVSNGYMGYMPYYSTAITTKHNGIITANYTSSNTASTTSSTIASRMGATYSNTSNVVMNVMVGSRSVSRNVTASVATSGSYWAWLQTAYNGLYIRFNGNLDLVATHIKLLECDTFNSVHGLANFTASFVTNKNLVTNRVECGQHLDLVRSGLIQMAVRSKSYTAQSLQFADTKVIESIRTTYKRVTTRKVTYIRKAYTQKVQSLLTSTQTTLSNITVHKTSGTADNQTATTVVDTGYIAGNTTSTTEQTGKNATAVTTTSSTTTTTVMAANASMSLNNSGSNNTISTASLLGNTANGFTGSTTSTTSGNNGMTSTNSGMISTNGMTSTTNGVTGVTSTKNGMTSTSNGMTSTSNGMTSTSNGMTSTMSGANGMTSTTNGATGMTQPGVMTPGSMFNPNVTPSPTVPGATPSPTVPRATPSPTVPGATPSPTIPGSMPKPNVTPAPTMPNATPSPTVPRATPSPTTPTPTPAATNMAKTCTEVSVEGDATYCINGPICSGNGASPAGSLCPKKGDIAVRDCRQYLFSYTNAHACIAPQDAMCTKIKTGAWGCVFTSQRPSTPAPTVPTSGTPVTPSPTTPRPVTPAPTTPGIATPAPTVPNSGMVTPAPTQPLVTRSKSAKSTVSMTATTSNAAVAAASSSNISAAAIAAIAAAACVVVALAGFTVHKMRTTSKSVDLADLSPTAQYTQTATPFTTQSIQL